MIGFLVVGNKKKGSGHIKRCLLLSKHLNEKSVFFVKKKEKLAIEMLEDFGKKYFIYENTKQLNCFLVRNNIKKIINDCLDSTKKYILNLKNENRKIITFEDMGEGADYADAVINALYENSNSAYNEYFGYKYYLLEKKYIKKEKKIKKEIENVLITFGGTDSNNYTKKVYDFLKKENLNIIIIKGIGYKKNINHSFVYQDVRNMEDFIFWADVVITSNGRTVFECMAGKTPAVTICQNERELKHYFAEANKTVLNCGMNFDNLKKNWKKSKNIKKRETMYKKMLNIDFSKNMERVIKIIKEL